MIYAIAITAGAIDSGYTQLALHTQRKMKGAQQVVLAGVIIAVAGKQQQQQSSNAVEAVASHTAAP